MINNFCRFLFLIALATPVMADTKSEIRGLIREKMKLERQIIMVFSKHGLNENPEYTAVSAASLAASKAFMEARRKEPKLKPFYEASDKAQKRMIDAKLKGDKDAAKAAQSEFTQARMDLERASAELPELKEVHEKAIAANAVAQGKKLELLATVPEGKELLGQIAAMDVKIAALRKK